MVPLSQHASITMVVDVLVMKTFLCMQSLGDDVTLLHAVYPGFHEDLYVGEPAEHRQECIVNSVSGCHGQIVMLNFEYAQSNITYDSAHGIMISDGTIHE